MTWKTTNTAKGENKLYSDAKGVVPSLDLRFASQKNLNDYMTATPLVDHQRSMNGSNLSPGTFVNSSGLIEKSKTNLILYSELQVGWFFRNTTSAPDQSSPDGLSSAVLIAETTSTTNHYLNRDDVSVTAGNTYCLSVYLKKGTGATAPQWMTLFTNVSGFGGGDAYMASFDIQNGVKGSAGVSIIDFDIIDAGGGWYRCWITATATATVSDSSIAVVFNNNQSAVLPVQTYTGQTTSNVFVFGAQVEEGSFPSTYIPTTTVPSAAPRFDHDPTTGESLGLLIEESRENIQTNSEDSTGYSTLEIASTVPSNISSPDGQLNANVLTPTATSSNHHLNLVNSNTTNLTVSVYAKANTYRYLIMGGRGSNNASTSPVFDLQSGTVAEVGGSVWSASITPAGDNWYRCSITATLGTGGVVVGVVDTATRHDGQFLADGTSNLYVWGFQVEESATFPTSYIPTAGTALTRNADVASITGTNFSDFYNQKEGTVFADITPVDVETIALLAYFNTTSFFESHGIIKTNATSNGPGLYINADNYSGGSGTINLDSNNTGQRFKAAYSYKDSDFKASYEGGAVLTGVWRSPSPTNFWLGQRDAGVFASRTHIFRFTYFPERLPDATLQAITAS